MNIYVGNLSFDVTEEELQREFTLFGEVLSVNIMNDKYIGSGQAQGYAYVEMSSKAEGKAAIAALDNITLRQKKISLVEALPLSDKEIEISRPVKKANWPRSKTRRRSDGAS